MCRFRDDSVEAYDNLHSWSNRSVSWRAPIFNVIKTLCRLRPYGIFQFIAAGNNYGKTSIQTQSARVSECEGAVFSSDDVPKISANVIFSSNPKHKSYNKEVGVSDRYGFVEIPRITGDFEFGTVYSTQITM